MHVDWGKIKAEYLAGGTSYRKLAEKYGVSYQMISRKAKAEKWQELVVSVRHKAETKVVQRIVNQRAADIAALDAARSKLIHKLTGAIDNFPDIAGNRMEQSMSERVDAVDESGKGGARGRKPLKYKSVRVEADLLKMADALEKLMSMTGYALDPVASADDGFLDALNRSAKDVTESDADIPEDLA